MLSAGEDGTVELRARTMWSSLPRQWKSTYSNWLLKPTEKRIDGDAHQHRIALLTFFEKYIKSVTVIDVIYVLKIGCQYE